MKKVFYVICLCIIGPFIIMAVEYIWALFTGATGERLASAGFYGVLVGYFSIPVGLVLLAIYLIAWLLRR